MADFKSPEEIDRANRMFAIESAVKLGVVPDGPTVIDHAREFHQFLSEGSEIPEPEVGFRTP